MYAYILRSMNIFELRTLVLVEKNWDLGCHIACNHSMDTYAAAAGPLSVPFVWSYILSLCCKKIGADVSACVCLLRFLSLSSPLLYFDCCKCPKREANAEPKSKTEPCGDHFFQGEHSHDACRGRITSLHASDSLMYFVLPKTWRKWWTRRTTRRRIVKKKANSTRLAWRTSSNTTLFDRAEDREGKGNSTRRQRSVGFRLRYSRRSLLLA